MNTLPDSTRKGINWILDEIEKIAENRENHLAFNLSLDCTVSVQQHLEDWKTVKNLVSKTRYALARNSYQSLVSNLINLKNLWNKLKDQLNFDREIDCFLADLKQ